MIKQNQWFSGIFTEKKQKRYLPSFYLDVDSPTPFEYVEYKDILPQRVPSSDLT